MNDIATRHSSLPANFGETLMKGIAETRSTMTVSDGGKPLLRLLKSGVWVFGQSNEPVAKGSQWAVNIASLSRGWVCWSEGELLGQAMASVQVERIPQPAPINGETFTEQFGMELTCITGKDDGTLVLYKNNSVGFKRAFEKLLAEIQTRWSSDKQYFWPVVELEQEDYSHKKYGTIYNPLLPIVAWTDEESQYSPDSDFEDEPAPEPVAVAPKRVRNSRQAPPEPAPVEEPVTSQQAHTGQRRRPVAR